MIIRFVFLLILGWLSSLNSNAQYEVKAPAGYSPEIGKMVWMLEDIKNQVYELTRDLSQEQTDYLFDDKANSIGSLIMHLVSTEAYYMIESLEGRSWTEEEEKKWGLGGVLGEETKTTIKGKPVSYYLSL